MNIYDILQENLLDMAVVRKTIGRNCHREIKRLNQDFSEGHIPEDDFKSLTHLALNDANDMHKFINLTESSIDEAIEFLATLDTTPRETLIWLLEREYVKQKGYSEIAYKLAEEYHIPIEKAAEIAEIVIHDFLERQAISG